MIIFKKWRCEVKPTHNIVHGRKYIKDGKEHTAWTRCGKLFIDKEQGRMAIKIDVMPVPSWNDETGRPDFDGWFAVFPNTKKQSPTDEARAVDNSDPQAMIDDGEPINLSDIPF